MELDPKRTSKRSILAMWLPARRGRAKEAVTGTAHLHVSDAAEGQRSEWFLKLGPAGRMSYEHIHQKGDAVLRGTASDILLTLWVGTTIEC